LGKDSTRRKILAVLSDGKARSSKEIAEAAGIGGEAVENALRKAQRRGLVLRTEKPLKVRSKAYKGPRGN